MFYISLQFLIIYANFTQGHFHFQVMIRRHDDHINPKWLPSNLLFGGFRLRKSGDGRACVAACVYAWIPWEKVLHLIAAAVSGFLTVLCPIRSTPHQLQSHQLPKSKPKPNSLTTLSLINGNVLYLWTKIFLLAKATRD